MKSSSLSERLHTVRKRTGLSQADFGKKLGISDRAYKNYELEIRKLPIEAAKLICHEFAIDIRWLLLGQGFIDSQALGDAVEAAVLETKAFFMENDVQMNPKQEAKIVRFLVQQIEENGSISEDIKRSFFEAII
ncbi:MAG: helix-turn-helix transcriptional regulator [Rhodospirillaceae bacterium]|nr:helix-turn-helix transcriptional regulator [Rhodospirillaceae bacterium]